MEENKNPNSGVNIFTDALNKESARIGHPSESPMFALNATIEGYQGNSFRYQTEQGNEDCFSLPEGYVPIGKIYIEDNTLVIFSTNNVDSEIGLVKDCQYEKIINEQCLYFSTEYPITGQSRIRRGCDRTIYWRDSYNSDRYLNIDEYLRCNEFDCNKITFNPQVLEPCIDLVSVNNQGGSLELGTYSFGVEILDKNENLIHRSDLSRKIPIYDEFTTDSYSNIDGGYNIAIYPPENGGVPKSNKSITLKFSGLDTDFAFLRVFVRYAVTGDGVTTQSHYVGNLIPITDTEETFTYSGYNVDNGDFQIPNTQTVIPKIIFDRSKSMEQVQGRLLRANVSEPYIDITEYQQAASKIWTNWTIKPDRPDIKKCLKLYGTAYGDEGCEAGVIYTIKYKRNGIPVELSDTISFVGTALKKNLDIDREIECVELTGSITDVELTYECIVQFGCETKCFLEAIVEGADISELPGSSKDVNTYWMDSTFMDDEVYAFGIVFEHSNGYKSPVFHIPGIAKDTQITDGVCHTVNPSFAQQKCLSIKRDIPIPEGCNIRYDYDLSFKVNGIDYSFNDNFYTGNGEPESKNFPITVFCGKVTDEITDVVFNYTCESVSVQGEPVIGADCSDLDCKIYWEIENITLGGEPSLDNLDSTVITEWSPDLIPFTDLSPTDYNALPSVKKLQRWQVYNTANGVTSGRMAYYECKDSLYVQPDSCCVQNYWGKDYCGNTLEGTPIRHHKFPCKSILPGAGHKLGIQFNNITYPSDDIISHFFVVGKRTENNKTVLDQGVAGNLGKDNFRTAFSFLQPNLGLAKPGKGFKDCSSYLKLDTERLWYITPKMLFGKEYINAGYLKFIKRVAPTSVSAKSIDVDEVDQRATSKTDVFLGTRVKCYGTYNSKNNNEYTYYPIYKNYIIDPYSEYQDSTQLISNLSNTNKIGFIRTKDVFKLANHDLALVSLKVNRDVYCNLETIQYVRLHNCNLTLNDTASYEIYGGDVFNSRPTIVNSFLWKVNKNYLKAVGAILALAVIAAASFLLPGSTLAVVGLTAQLAAVVGALAIVGSGAVIYKAIETYYIDFNKKKFVNFLCDKQLNDILDQNDDDWEDYVALANEFINNFEFTSEINGELRHSAVNICGTYPKFEPSASLCAATQDKLYGYLKDRVTYYDEEKQEIKVLQMLCPEYYGYNKDYSLIYGEKVYFSVPRTYDFCRACNNEFRNTIWYSEKSFDTELKDNYLVNLTNNSVDIPAHRGEIFNIKHKSNVLYIQCKETTFALQPNPQMMKTDKDLVVLGTGDFLALPPQELMQTDVGYGGSQSTTAYCNTEHGFVWADQSKGEIYNLAEGMQEISQVRMEPWFKENLSSEFAKEFFRTTGQEYPFFDAITDSKGLGMSMVYDPKHDRLIIHKKDYKPLRDVILEDGSEDVKKIYFNGENFYIYEFSGSNRIKFTRNIQFTDKEYFENKSWTISYSLKYKKWISYHSYMSMFTYNDRNFFYTSDNNKIYRHLHNGNYLTYYGLKFPFIIEGAQTQMVTSSLHAFHYISTSELFNNDTQTFILKPDVTFNKAYFYNTDETSGLLDIVFLNQHTNPYGNIVLPESTKSVIYTDENYKIAGIRDVSTGSPVISRGWNDIENYFNVNNSNHGYIDLVPVNYSHSVTQYQLKELNDKLLIYRLIYEPKQEDVRISLILNNLNSMPSYR